LLLIHDTADGIRTIPSTAPTSSTPSTPPPWMRWMPPSPMPPPTTRGAGGGADRQRPKAFVAGADIAEMNTLTPVQGRDFSLRGTRMMRRVERMPKPVIAMVNGFALGGGLELAMCCHLRIAADSAKVGQPEINLGLIPGFGGSQRLLRLCGRAATLELCLTGAPINAERALQLGIVNRVVPAAELEAETMKLAAQLAASAPLALRGMLDCVNVGGECGIEEGLEYEAAQFGLVFSTEDMREGTSAFLEKRKPAFAGK
jgi:enoyl-CoA hydratase